jgi:membrane-associated protease RseP (regulator of RpoE activity)
MNPLVRVNDGVTAGTVKRLWLHVVLFFTTVLTTFASFFFSFSDASGPMADRLVGAGLFSFCAMLILGAHEMGHYLMARQHGVDSSLPYFIPLPPFFGFGTMGAVIRLKGRIPSRNALVDIGAAGPLAGLLIAVPLLAVGISLCRIGDAPQMPPLFPGTWSLWTLAPKLVELIFGAGTESTEMGSQFFGHNLLTWGFQELIVGPLPPGKDLYVHPVFLAAWFGMVVTMLNLMPIGQLDAGHLTFAWFGPRAVTIGKVMSAVLVVFIVFFSATWIIWFLLTRKLVGYGHPEVTLPEEPLSPGRKVVCAVCFVFFALTLMPVVMSL